MDNLTESRVHLNIAKEIAQKAGWLEEEHREAPLKLRDCLAIATLALEEAANYAEHLDPALGWHIEQTLMELNSYLTN